MKRIYGMAVCASFFALAAAAQDTMAQKKMQEELSIALTKMKVIGFEGGVMSNVKGAPYRGDQVTESTQMLGDGTRIHNERTLTIYRDSQGRVRRETPEQISIWDPNSGLGYTLDPKNMTANKMQVHVSVSSGSPGAGALAFRTNAITVTGGDTVRTQAATVVGSGETVKSDVMVKGDVMMDIAKEGMAPGAIGIASAKFGGGEFRLITAGPAKKESLGTQTLEGVSAQGNRETSTIEAGAIGNDRPIEVVSEHWYSPDLQMDVMTRHSDPRTGEEVTRLINISRAEPDPSLFELPSGYQLNESKTLPALPRLRQQ